MARLLLARSEPITLAEACLLPEGARVDNGPAGGRVELLCAEDPATLARMAYALGQAAPGGRLEVELRAALVASSPTLDPLYTEEQLPPPDSAWALLERGLEEPALEAFARQGLDPDGRERVRELFQSTDPAQVALACRIATAANWRSFVTPLRRVLDHADVRVRAAAVRAVGALAGPALAWQIERMIQDPSPEVRKAVLEALAAIEGRGGR